METMEENDFLKTSIPKLQIDKNICQACGKFFDLTNNTPYSLPCNHTGNLILPYLYLLLACKLCLRNFHKEDKDFKCSFDNTIVSMHDFRNLSKSFEILRYLKIRQVNSSPLDGGQQPLRPYQTNQEKEIKQQNKDEHQRASSVLSMHHGQLTSPRRQDQVSLSKQLSGTMQQENSEHLQRFESFHVQGQVNNQQDTPINDVKIHHPLVDFAEKTQAQFNNHQDQHQTDQNPNEQTLTNQQQQVQEVIPEESQNEQTTQRVKILSPQNEPSQSLHQISPAVGESFRAGIIGKDGMLTSNRALKTPSQFTNETPQFNISNEHHLQSQGLHQPPQIKQAILNQSINMATTPFELLDDQQSHIGKYSTNYNIDNGLAQRKSEIHIVNHEIVPFNNQQEDESEYEETKVQEKEGHVKALSQDYFSNSASHQALDYNKAQSQLYQTDQSKVEIPKNQISEIIKPSPQIETNILNGSKLGKKKSKKKKKKKSLSNISVYLEESDYQDSEGTQHATTILDAQSLKSEQSSKNQKSSKGNQSQQHQKRSSGHLQEIQEDEKHHYHELLTSFLEDLWNKFDLDQDGYIDMEESTYFYNNLIQERGAELGLSSKNHQEWFSKIDTQNQGQLSQQDLLDYLIKIGYHPEERPDPHNSLLQHDFSERKIEELVQYQFFMHDHDQDGYMNYLETKETFQIVIEDSPELKLNVENHKIWFDMLDTDLDGHITKEELSSYLVQLKFQEKDHHHHDRLEKLLWRSHINYSQISIYLDYIWNHYQTYGDGLLRQSETKRVFADIVRSKRLPTLTYSDHEQWYQSIDTDKLGGVSKRCVAKYLLDHIQLWDPFSAKHAGFIGRVYLEAYVDYIWNKYDIDKDQFFYLSQAQIVFQDLTEEIPVQDIGVQNHLEWFSLLDVENHGCISKEGMVKHLLGIQESLKQEEKMSHLKSFVQELIMICDLDEDGQLNFSESLQVFNDIYSNREVLGIGLISHAMWFKQLDSHQIGKLSSDQIFDYFKKVDYLDKINDQKVGTHRTIQSSISNIEQIPNEQDQNIQEHTQINPGEINLPLEDTFVFTLVDETKQMDENNSLHDTNEAYAKTEECIAIQEDDHINYHEKIGQSRPIEAQQKVEIQGLRSQNTIQSTNVTGLTPKVSSYRHPDVRLKKLKEQYKVSSQEISSHPHPQMRAPSPQQQIIDTSQRRKMYSSLKSPNRSQIIQNNNQLRFQEPQNFGNPLRDQPGQHKHQIQNTTQKISPNIPLPKNQGTNSILNASNPQIRPESSHSVAQAKVNSTPQSLISQDHKIDYAPHELNQVYHVTQPTAQLLHHNLRAKSLLQIRSEPNTPESSAKYIKSQKSQFNQRINQISFPKPIKEVQVQENPQLKVANNVTNQPYAVPKIQQNEQQKQQVQKKIQEVNQSNDDLVDFELNELANEAKGLYLLEMKPQPTPKVESVSVNQTQQSEHVRNFSEEKNAHSQVVVDSQSRQRLNNLRQPAPLQHIRPLPEQCKLHKRETIKYFCNDEGCQTGICPECIIFHSKHEFMTISDAISRGIKNIVKQAHVNSREQIRHSKKVKIQAEKKMADLNLTKTNEFKRLSAFFEELHLALKQREQQLTQLYQQEIQEYEDFIQTDLASAQDYHSESLKLNKQIKVFLDQQMVSSDIAVVGSSEQANLFFKKTMELQQMSEAINNHRLFSNFEEGLEESDYEFAFPFFAINPIDTVEAIMSIGGIQQQQQEPDFNDQQPVIKKQNTLDTKLIHNHHQQITPHKTLSPISHNHPASHNINKTLDQPTTLIGSFRFNQNEHEDHNKNYPEMNSKGKHKQSHLTQTQHSEDFTQLEISVHQQQQDNNRSHHNEQTHKSMVQSQHSKAGYPPLRSQQQQHHNQSHQIQNSIASLDHSTHQVNPSHSQNEHEKQVEGSRNQNNGKSEGKDLHESGLNFSMDQQRYQRQRSETRIDKYERQRSSLKLSRKGSLRDDAETPEFEQYQHSQSQKNMHWFKWDTNEVYRFDATTRKWVKRQDVKNSSHFLFFSSIVHLPNEQGCFILGGADNHNNFSKRVQYFCKYNVFVEKPPMISKRAFSTAVFFKLDNSIYSLGGRESHSSDLNKCEKFSLIEHVWRPIAPMNASRNGASAVIFDKHRLIFAFGGNNHKHGSISNIEKYEIDFDKWTIITLQMKAALHDLTVFPLGRDRVLILGGHTNTEPNKEIDLIDLTLECSNSKAGKLSLTMSQGGKSYQPPAFNYQTGKIFMISGYCDIEPLVEDIDIKELLN